VRINPLFPALSPATGFSNGLHAKSKFLALTVSTPASVTEVENLCPHAGHGKVKDSEFMAVISFVNSFIE
jgi:hypothetical protein